MKSGLLGIKIFIFCIVVLMGILTIIVSLPLQTPFKAFVVLSGSMSPNIRAGSIVLVQQETTFQKGDVITFIHPSNPMDYVTHRITDLNNEGKSFSYQTKGDANETADLWTVRKEAVWGKVALTIPLIGYLISFSKTTVGLILLIILPLLCIAISEIRVIIKEVKRIRAA